MKYGFMECVDILRDVMYNIKEIISLESILNEVMNECIEKGQI